MPGQVLTTASKITCGHAPNGITLAPPPVHKLTVGGQPVLLATDVTTATLGGCTQASPPGPCTKAPTLTTGPSTKLKVGGVPVLLSDLSATAMPSGMLTVVTAGTKVTAV